MAALDKSSQTLFGMLAFHAERNTKYVRLMKEFFMKHDLVSVWEKFDVDYTYQHNNYTSLSTLDHFFVTERFLSNCISAAPLHFPDNKSGHSPIMLKISVPEIAERTHVEPQIMARPNWRKADEFEIEDYSQALHAKLSSWPRQEGIE